MYLRKKNTVLSPESFDQPDDAFGDSAFELTPHPPIELESSFAPQPLELCLGELFGEFDAPQPPPSETVFLGDFASALHPFFSTGSSEEPQVLFGSGFAEDGPQPPPSFDWGLSLSEDLPQPLELGFSSGELFPHPLLFFSGSGGDDPQPHALLSFGDEPQPPPLEDGLSSGELLPHPPPVLLGSFDVDPHPLELGLSLSGELPQPLEEDGLSSGELLPQPLPPPLFFGDKLPHLLPPPELCCGDEDPHFDGAFMGD